MKNDFDAKRKLMIRVTAVILAALMLGTVLLSIVSSVF